MTTLLIRNDIRLNEKTGKYNNYGVIREKIKDIKHKGEILEFINTTETTADKPFCEIKFKCSNKIYIEMLHRINFNLKKK